MAGLTSRGGWKRRSLFCFFAHALALACIMQYNGRVMPRVTTVNSAAKPQGNCGKCGKPIQKGDAYRWWKFRWSAKSIRCLSAECAPTEQDLTQSEYSQRCYDFAESLSTLLGNHRDQELPDSDGLADELDALAGEVREFGEEQRSKVENMPPSLQQSPTADLLNERADSLEEKAQELEGAAGTARGLSLVDVTDTQAIREWAEGSECEIKRDSFPPGDDFDAAWLDKVREAAVEHNQEEIGQAIDEAEGVSFGD